MVEANRDFEPLGRLLERKTAQNARLREETRSQADRLLAQGETIAALMEENETLREGLHKLRDEVSIVRAKRDLVAGQLKRMSGEILQGADAVRRLGK